MLKSGKHKHLLLTKCLKFPRVEVIQKAEKPLLHFLNVWDISKKGMLNRGWLSTFSLSSLRFCLFFHHSANKIQIKTVFKKRWLFSDGSRLSKISELKFPLKTRNQIKFSINKTKLEIKRSCEKISNKCIKHNY